MRVISEVRGGIERDVAVAWVAFVAAARILGGGFLARS